MKKLFVIALVLIGMSSGLLAQNKKLQEKIQSMKIALITEELNLTPEVAQQFWPLFNQFEEDKRQLKGSYNLPKNFNQLSDEEAEKVILASLEMEEKEVGLKRAYYAKLKNVLSAQQIAKLHKAERTFKEKIIKIINQRRKQERQRRRNG
ncbi:MAG: hypothetical protein AAF985_14925 [Bacteroidota bacterium]